MRTALYRHFDTRKRLLYVGISLHAVIRLSAHRLHARWFDQVKLVTVQWFETRAAAYRAEQRAIRSERPLYNNGGRPPQSSLTELFAKRVTKPGTYSFGEGLELRVTSTGTKTWRFRYSWSGRRTHITLHDRWSTMSLKDARSSAGEYRQLLAVGGSPIEEQRELQRYRRDKRQRERERAEIDRRWREGPTELHGKRSRRKSHGCNGSASRAAPPAHWTGWRNRPEEDESP